MMSNSYNHDDEQYCKKQVVVERKTVEKNRRVLMKALCANLVSLIPPNYFPPSQYPLSQPEQVDQAVAYITRLSRRIEKLKKKKEEALRARSTPAGTRSSSSSSKVEVRDWGTAGIEVSLISGVEKNYFLMYEAISVLEQEGAEVASASFSTVGDQIFLTIHARVKITRVGVETARVCTRLKEMINY